MTTTTAHSIRARARGIPQPMLDALAARFGADFSTAMAVREHHGRDESPFPVTPPEAVVFAQSNEDVVDAVKLCLVPEAMSAAVCCFESLRDAVDTVIAAIQLGVPMARCEYLDPFTIRAINAYSKTSLREAHSLFFEFHGTEAGAREQAETVQAVAAEHRGQDFEWAERPEDRNRLWNARHTAFFAGLASRPGCRAIITDTCVPISRLAECITGARAILDRTASPTSIAGHVGDGNFHCGILVDPDDAAEIALAEKLNEEIVRLALSMDGTCTGEHGIGLHKIAFLREEAGDKGVELMRRVKRALDPDGIFNPGKIFTA